MTGRRDPLVPPRRLGLPSQLAAPGRRFLEVGLIDAGGLQPDERVLDIGCGPGRIAALLARHLTRGSYEGFDVMPEAIEWCRRGIAPRYPSFGFQLVDVANPRYNPDGRGAGGDARFPYPDAEFDLAFANSLYTHLRPGETERYLAETVRVLRPGGRAIASFFLLNDEAEALIERTPDETRAMVGNPTRRFDHELTDSSGVSFRTSSPEIPEHRIGLREEDVIAMHRRAGLEVTDIRYGHWCGREMTADRIGQDLVVSRPA